jgi:hypothetical protein
VSAEARHSDACQPCRSERRPPVHVSRRHNGALSRSPNDRMKRHGQRRSLRHGKGRRRDRSCLHLLSFSAALDGRVDVKLRDGGADDGMNLCGQLSRGRCSFKLAVPRPSPRETDESLAYPILSHMSRPRYAAPRLAARRCGSSSCVLGMPPTPRARGSGRRRARGRSRGVFRVALRWGRR